MRYKTRSKLLFIAITLLVFSKVSKAQLIKQPETKGFMPVVLIENFSCIKLCDEIVYLIKIQIIKNAKPITFSAFLF